MTQRSPADIPARTWRFGDSPITSPYLVSTPDFVACHVPSYLYKYDVLKGIKRGGTFLLNSLWSVEETLKRIPDHVKQVIAEKGLKVYIINATKIAEEIGLGNRTNTILQSAFFKITGIIPYEQAVAFMKKAIDKSYGKKGEKVVSMNYAAVDRGAEYEELTVPAEWNNVVARFRPANFDRLAPEWVRSVADVVNAQNGYDIPVSAFTGEHADGTIPAGTAAFEKRGIAVNVPEWNPEKCIQCNQCAFVCPHAASVLSSPPRKSCQRHLRESEAQKARPRSRPTASLCRYHPWTAPAAATAWTYVPPRRKPSS